jgi:uncharacterized membrane protein YphA (DoxX/SURF4 family)
VNHEGQRYPRQGDVPSFGLRARTFRGHMRRLTTIISAAVLAMAFAAAAWAKSRDREGTRSGAIGLGVPIDLASAVAVVLPVVETLVVVLLVVGFVARWFAVAGAVCALILLLLFTVAMIRTLSRGRAPACHCFGSRRAKPIGPDAVMRNVALSALAIVVLVG